MNRDQRYSDEFLNAFVDNQLDPEEKSRAYADLSRDESLNRQVCELRKLHDLVQLAYRNPPLPPARKSEGGRRAGGWRFGVAATVLLTLGVALGTQIHGTDPAPAPTTRQSAVSPSPQVRQTTPPPTVASQPVRSAKPEKVVRIATTAAPAKPAPAAVAPAPAAVAKASDVAPPAAPQVAAADVAPAPAAQVSPATPPRASAADAKTKVLIHLSRDDYSHLSQALDEIEGALKHYRAIRESAHVEVVVNGKGLELVRLDTSRFADRIQRLQREYSNITFAACLNTLDRIKLEQGISVRLLPGVITIDSGVAEIMRRQSQGWTYLQV